MKQLLLNHSEVNYIKHYFQKESRLACAALIILALFVLGFLIPMPLVNAALTLFGGEISHFNGTDTGELSLVFIAICIMAYLLPLYLFRFLMNRSGNDLYLSLPIERKRLFYIHYLIGLIYLICVSLILLVIYCVFNDLTTLDNINLGFSHSIILYFLLNLGFIVLGVCLYSFFTYITVRCHTLLDAIVMSMIYTLLPLLIYYSLIAFCGHIMDDALVSISGDLSEGNIIKNMLEMFVALISVPWQMNLWVTLFGFYELDSVYSVELLILCGAVWVLIGIACFIGGAKAFERIRSEQSGQTTGAFFTYPLLIPLVTFLLLLGVQRPYLITGPTAVIALGYMLANFFARRKISFSFRRCLTFILLTLTSFLLFITLSRTHLFGTLKEIPTLEQIESVSFEITADYQTAYDSNPNYNGYCEDQDEIAQILDAHEAIVKLAAGKTKRQNYSWDYYVSYEYVTKDHKIITRTYVFDKEEQEVVLSLLKKWQEQGLIKENVE